MNKVCLVLGVLFSQLSFAGWTTILNIDNTNSTNNGGFSVSTPAYPFVYQQSCDYRLVLNNENILNAVRAYNGSAGGAPKITFSADSALLVKTFNINPAIGFGGSGIIGGASVLDIGFTSSTSITVGEQLYVVAIQGGVAVLNTAFGALLDTSSSLVFQNTFNSMKIQKRCL